ncbi:MAG: MFS transporter [candidate division Zixibacteria bacterium]|nr:MFS transporter [candidate division Zixibacteria bacterium]
MRSVLFRKDVMGWSLYDFANTIFSMNIISLYLKRYIVEDLGKDDRWFDIPYSISMVIAAIVLPAMGAISDHSTKKKMFVILFTITCCIATGLMSLVPASAVMVIVLLLIISNFTYEASMPFYNALLYSVAYGKEARFVSGFGVAFGYMGAILGVLAVGPFVDMYGKQGSFLPTAVMFLLLSIPFVLWVREKPVKFPGKATIKKGYQDVWDGIRLTKKYPGVARFLVADYFFEDAVTTVIINISLYCSIVLGFSELGIRYFLIITPISAVIGSYIIGHLSRTYCLKKMLNIIIWGWVISLIAFVFVENVVLIYILGSIVGILLGGLWTTSRPLLAELVPQEELGRFFGLFSLSGRAAAIVGPLLWTTVVYFFNPQRPMGQLVIDVLNIEEADQAALPYKIGILTLVVMMLVGLYIFRKVPTTESKVSG